MTFDEILEQVITLLKRQGRVSYPALKVRSPAPCASVFSVAGGTMLARRHHGLA